MKRLICGMAAALMPVVLALTVTAGEPERYSLRYKFHPGETVRWEVEHRSNIRATVSGTTQKTETLSTSMKAWRVISARPDGTATFEHVVEWVDMRHNLSGRDEVRYNSRTDRKPPVGFESAAKSVGVPLSTVTLDATGKVLRRDRPDTKPRPSVGKGAKPQPAVATADSTPASESWITIPLPAEPVPVGYTWSLPQNIEVPLPDGAVKKIKAVQQFTLEEVRTGVATIRFSTCILTPITDPAIESQLVGRDGKGAVRFDIDEGRVLSQQIDSDKKVVGFRGDASSIHYVNRFSERLVPAAARTAAQPGTDRR